MPEVAAPIAPPWSAFIKRDLLYYCLIQLKHSLAATECLNSADLVSVTSKKGQALLTEYEIKTSRADLKKELDVILYVIDEDYYRRLMEKEHPGEVAIFGPDYPLGQELLQRQRSIRGSWNKYRKHSINILGKQTPGYCPPNYFYFVVTPDLIEYALERLEKENSPYGVISYHPHIKDSYSVSRRARQLHARPMEDRFLWGVMRRSCLENMTLRRKILAVYE